MTLLNVMDPTYVTSVNTTGNKTAARALPWQLEHGMTTSGDENEKS